MEYNLTLPLVNKTESPQSVALSIQTPLQNDSLKDALQFYANPAARVFFRGTVLFIYKDNDGRSRAYYTYLVQNRGQQGEPLVELTLAPGEQRDVNVQFLYPPRRYAAPGINGYNLSIKLLPLGACSQQTFTQECRRIAKPFAAQEKTYLGDTDEKGFIDHIRWRRRH